MGAARFILQLSISMVIAMIAIVLVYVHSTKDTSKTQESNVVTSVVTSVVTDSVPSYIDDIRSLSLGEVHSITTYLISGDDFATVTRNTQRIRYIQERCRGLLRIVNLTMI